MRIIKYVALTTLAYLSLGCASYAFPAATADGKYLGQDSWEQYKKFELLASLLTYMGVFDLVQTRAACSDGFFDHCIFVSPSTTKGEGFYVKLF